jgi:hypothetical protein
MPFTLLGHTDFFPEYYFNTPNGQPFKPAHISIFQALVEGKGNLFQKPKDIEAHSFYMADGGKISACYEGKWLGGGEPNADLVNESIRTWIESTAVMMMDKAGDYLKNASYNWVHLLHPHKNVDTVVDEKDKKEPTKCFLGIFCKLVLW